MKTIETDIIKSLGGRYDVFDFKKIKKYHDLLKCVEFGLHDEMPVAVSPSRPLPDGGYIQEKHYVALMFPNGDMLDRIEVYEYNQEGEVVRHSSHSAIQSRTEDGKVYEKVNHTRERELGMVLYYMEDCISEQAKK